MEIRILGRDLEVSEIGFGCMGMSHAYGTVSTQKEAEEKMPRLHRFLLPICRCRRCLEAQKYRRNKRGEQ